MEEEENREGAVLRQKEDAFLHGRRVARRRGSSPLPRRSTENLGLPRRAARSGSFSSDGAVVEPRGDRPCRAGRRPGRRVRRARRGRRGCRRPSAARRPSTRARRRRARGRAGSRSTAARPRRSSSKGSVDAPSRTRMSSTFASVPPFGAALPVETWSPAVVAGEGFRRGRRPFARPRRERTRTQAASAARRAFIRSIVRGAASGRAAQLRGKSAPVEEAHRAPQDREDARVVRERELLREEAIDGRQERAAAS